MVKLVDIEQYPLNVALTILGLYIFEVIKRNGLTNPLKSKGGDDINLAGGKETVTPAAAVGRDTVIRAGAL